MKVCPVLGFVFAIPAPAAGHSWEPAGARRGHAVIGPEGVRSDPTGAAEGGLLRREAAGGTEAARHPAELGAASPCRQARGAGALLVRAGARGGELAPGVPDLQAPSVLASSSTPPVSTTSLPATTELVTSTVPSPAGLPETSAGINGTSVTAPLAAAAGDCKNWTNANGTDAGACPDFRQQGFIERQWAVVLGILLLSICGMGALLLRTPERREKVTEKPVSWIARTVGLLLMCKLLVVSLPKVGFLFNGCFWSSVGGLSAVAALAAACIPPFFELLDHPAPLAATGPHISAGLLVSSGASGVSLAIWFGEAVCAHIFFWLSFVLCIDGLLFGWAWWRGEGGGAMGLLRGRGIR
mmetsp:Transcript_129317/g.360168  ORF Transcript_129317/g.360168 Transcript_129317/m.360168 type:complete len:355 (+) Transcript_129317:200-1264(+)